MPELDKEREIENDFLLEQGVVIGCILFEGVVSVGCVLMGDVGEEYIVKTYNLSLPLEEGNLVVFDNHKENTYSATEGFAVVKKLETEDEILLPDPDDNLIGRWLGQIISTPKLVVFPTTQYSVNTWKQVLVGRYYRTAMVQWLIKKKGGG